jgi:raffinose/stachyose/melibiose transport system permease protein
MAQTNQLDAGMIAPSSAEQQRQTRRMAQTDRLRKILTTTFIYVLLTIFVIIAVGPFLISAFTGFKTNDEIVRGAFSLPEVWRWSNYADAWKQARFGDYFGNSVIVVIPVVLGSVALSILTGYAFGRMRFRFSRALFMLFLLGVIMPTEAYIIPLYYLMDDLGLVDTYWALILPQIALSVCFGTFWMRGFFAAIPTEIVDAARIDGCTDWGALWRVMLPLVRPAILTLVVLLFIWTWNDFLLALVMISKEELRTLPQGLAFFQGRYTTNVPMTAAGATLVALPTIIIYFALQRHFIRGLTSGATTG